MLTIIEPRPDTLLPGRPIYTERIPAGFPSPAAGYEKQDLNLHEYCVRHPSATYFLRVEGNSMEDARIHDGDVLVVDRALEPEHGSIVIAAVDNEFTVKRLLLHPRPCLMPMNPAYSPLYFDPDSDTVQLWGVVSYSVMRHL
ncbi:TPA: translesion error-prone DNA polymerase V autoproteolytic subunit [Klebsiella pneumoniae]|jgi:DNA polymerase V|uniref:DNA polymerase V subunit UmuD n=1 Tax=Klebsiella pneumoniae TaxID=573 RepID=A0A3G4RIZ6_KLEPN|nr:MULTISPECIES: translesion error-prone DNA polymerase V autoproteolytic subunit [Enterobacteriaceae]EKW3164712.1 translesion error-prone DNA polymerase V autoproteolytic subunit [Shigella dysenteriae]HBQ6990582.1 translesion error-prone DNA polymerase V autoproteolytic subunit [Klebsiella quasipneumoniae subsp. similipneumoniae]HED2223285.1 translesion error-prone DNA polymerase V autoproteolytic subunit [Enterobacter hormaechei subsp. steigerwaltii]AYU65623.1 DNA polymerase V subunit UmuD [K